jgi:hypothetical protein
MLYLDFNTIQSNPDSKESKPDLASLSLKNIETRLD